VLLDSYPVYNDASACTLRLCVRSQENGEECGMVDKCAMLLSVFGSMFRAQAIVNAEDVIDIGIEIATPCSQAIVERPTTRV
jgi:hypothetical protein